MTDLQKRIFDAIVAEYNSTHKAIQIHKFAKKVHLSGDDMVLICKELVSSKHLVYIPSADKTALKNELIAPTSKYIN